MCCEKNGHDAIIKHATTEKEISQNKKNMLHHEPTIYTNGLRDVLFSFWKIPMFNRKKHIYLHSWWMFNYNCEFFWGHTTPLKLYR